MWPRALLGPVVALALVVAAGAGTTDAPLGGPTPAGGAAPHHGVDADRLHPAPEDGFEQGLERHLAEVRPLLERYGYAAVFGAIFVEGFGIPAPGQTLLIAASLLAADGELSLLPLLVLAFLASAGGTLAGWAIGRFGGRRILDRFAGPRLDRLEETCRRRGGLVVAFGRFVDGARQLAGIVAGALGLPLASFFWWNALGAVVWVAAWGLGSFLLERNVHALVDAYRRVGPVAAVLVLALAGALLVWLARGRRPSAA